MLKNDSLPHASHDVAGCLGDAFTPLTPFKTARLNGGNAFETAACPTSGTHPPGKIGMVRPEPLEKSDSCYDFSLDSRHPVVPSQKVF